MPPAKDFALFGCAEHLHGILELKPHSELFQIGAARSIAEHDATERDALISQPGAGVEQQAEVLHLNVAGDTENEERL